MRIRLNAGLAAMLALPVGALALGVLGAVAQPVGTQVTCPAGQVLGSDYCCRPAGNPQAACTSCGAGMTLNTSGACGCAPGSMFVPGSANRPDRCAPQAQVSTAVGSSTTLSSAQMLAQGQQIYSRGQSLSTRVQGMLDNARREGDVLRVTCLDDKLTQVNAHTRTLGSRLEALQEAAALQDRARENHEYTVIVVIGNQIIQLDRASSECIGQDMYETGTTRVVTTIDPNTPNINPNDLVIVGAEGVPFIPAPASGSM